jgi:uncharacterized protein with PQ loop repeat
MENMNEEQVNKNYLVTAIFAFISAILICGITLGVLQYGKSDAPGSGYAIGIPVLMSHFIAFLFALMLLGYGIANWKKTERWQRFLCLMPTVYILLSGFGIFTCGILISLLEPSGLWGTIRPILQSLLTMAGGIAVLGVCIFVKGRKKYVWFGGLATAAICFVFFIFYINTVNEYGMPIPENLDISVVNTGKKQLENTWVKMGDHDLWSGILSPGTTATELFVEHPLRDTASVHFAYDPNNEYTKTVCIKGVIPEKIKGSLSLYFNINSDTNDVVVSYRID